MRWSQIRKMALSLPVAHAADKKLKSMLHDTELHCIVVQIKGYDVVKMEEIAER